MEYLLFFFFFLFLIRDLERISGSCFQSVKYLYELFKIMTVSVFADASQKRILVFMVLFINVVSK